jgi:hypothetical protein
MSPISPEDTATVPLHRLAHARAGDKGDRLNISLICYREADFPLIRDQVTAQAVERLFAPRRPSSVTRYELPKLAAFNFVLENALGGGVNANLFLDAHGKTLSFLLLTLPVAIPAAMLNDLPGSLTV